MYNEFYVKPYDKPLYQPMLEHPYNPNSNVFINPQFPTSQAIVGRNDGGRQLIYDEFPGPPEAYLGAWPYDFKGYIGKNAQGIYGDGVLFQNEDLELEDIEGGDVPYCGLNKLKKGQKRGNLKECVESKQIRYYGLKKVDPNLVNKLKGNEKKKLVKELKLTYFKLSGKINKLNKKLNDPRLSPNDKNKLTNEKKLLQQEFNNVKKMLGLTHTLGEKSEKKILELPRNLESKIGLKTQKEYEKLKKLNKKNILNLIESQFEYLSTNLNKTADEYVKLNKEIKKLINMKKMERKKKLQTKNKTQLIQLDKKINKIKQNKKVKVKKDKLQKLMDQLDELKEQRNNLEEELEDNIADGEEDNDLLEEDIENLTFDIDDLEGKIYNIKLRRTLKN